MNLGCTLQIESKLSLHSLARDLREFGGWRIESLSYKNAYDKILFVHR
jgi:hypothetical protein